MRSTQQSSTVLKHICLPRICIFLLLALGTILLLCACNTVGNEVPTDEMLTSSEAEMTDSEQLTEDITDITSGELLESSEDETDSLAEPTSDECIDENSTEEETAETYPVIDVEDYKGLFFSAVYGNGGKSDAAAEHSFIQLYNSTNRDLSLYGLSLYYKSSGAVPFLQFPFQKGAVIPAGGYYLVRCKAASGYNTSYAVLGIENYDTEWKAEIDNKDIRLLLAPVGKALPKDTDVTSIEDAVDAFLAVDIAIEPRPIQVVDNMSKNKVAVRTALESYSGYHKASLDELATTELLRVCPKTSDGQKNTVISSRLNEVFFSHPAGIYTESVTLELTANVGYNIYITTDGSDPRENGILYSGALILSDSSEMSWKDSSGQVAETYGVSKPKVDTLIGGYVIKAYATNGTDSTPVYTSTYFVTSELKRLGATVMSISMNTEDIVGADGFYSNYEDGDLDTPRPRGLGMIEVFDKNGERVGYSNVEMAVSGHGSAGWAKKTLRLYYKGINNTEGGTLSDLDYDLFGGKAVDVNGNAITSFSRFLLRNSGNDRAESFIRDAFIQDMSSGLNIDTMASNSVLVFINGEFWGYYNARERYSGAYVEDHYGVNSDSVVVIENDYKYAGTSQRNEPYVVSSGPADGADHFNDLVAWARANDLSLTENFEYICAQMDVDSLIDMFCARIYFSAPDWPENNIKVWRNIDPEDPSGCDTKWHFTMLDCDFGIGLSGNHTSNNLHWIFVGSNSVCGNLMSDLLENESFKKQFLVRFYQLSTENFAPDKLLAAFDEWYDDVKPFVAYEVERWKSEGLSQEKWETAMTAIRTFLQNRQSYALGTVFAYFGVTEDEVAGWMYKKLTLSFNSDRVTLFINGDKAENGQMFKFDEPQRCNLRVDVADGYELSYITITWRKGTVEKYTAEELLQGGMSFIVSDSAMISVAVKKLTSEDANPLVESGIVAGATYMFYLADNGDLYAWGNNDYGILGVGSGVSNVSIPVFVMSNVRKVVTTRSADFENSNTRGFTAILTLDGKIYTVGCNDKGQLGRGGTLDSSTLGEVTFDGVPVDISAGYDHLLVLDESKDLYGIGSNVYGQLGSSKVGSNLLEFVKIAENVKCISAGRRNTYYVTTDGKLFGMGDNRWYKLNRTEISQITEPYLMANNIASVSAGEHQMVAVAEDGTLYYAGWKTFSTLTVSSNDPVMHRVMTGVVKAAMYHSNLVILAANGNVYVYGQNLGNAIGMTVLGTDPVKFTERIVDIAGGYGFTAYITEDGRLLVQGDNTYGQAANGSLGGTVKLAEVEMFS